MSEPPDRKLTIAMGALFGAMLLGVVALIVSAGWPKGEKIAAIDLRAPDPSAAVEVLAGDRLYFRTTIAMKPPPSKVEGYDWLRASKLSLDLVPPGGALKSAVCNVYDDEAMSISNVASGMTVSDAPIACAFTIETPGRYVVRSKVAWSSSASITAATLEVRRERKK